MKTTRRILFITMLTALVGSFMFWNWGFSSASAQVEKDDVQIEDASVGSAVEYNARNEFSLTQGGTTGVWRYGYTTTDASNTFVPYSLTNATTDCGAPADVWRFTSSGDQVPVIVRYQVPCNGTPTDSLHFHPGSGGERSVLRFVAPAAGTYQLTGAIQRANPVATTDLRILQNETTSLFTGDINSKYQLPFNLTVTVAANDTIDFSVGFGNGTYFSDGTTLNLTVSQAVASCITAPANLQVNVPAENSPSDVQSLNTNASLVGDAAYTNMGKVGRAFDLDGNGDYVRIEDNAAQRPATAVTAEGWFKFDSVGGVVSLISKPIRNSTLNSYTLYLDGGQLRGLVSNGPQFTRVFSSFTPQVGVWHHLAFTYDYTGGVSTLKLYANGVEVTNGQDGTANILPFYDANPYPLLIGGEFENNAPGFTLDGQADEVAVYGRALAQSEIFDIVQAGTYGKCLPSACTAAPNNLVSWFAGEQNALDAKSSNHGTLQNGTTFQTAKVGQGFKFDGVNDFVEIPDNANLKPATLTLETWVKFDSLTSTVTGGAPAGYQNIIFKKNSRTAGSGFEGGYSLVKNPSNIIGIGFNSPGGAENFANSTTAVQAGVWYHIVGTHDGTTIRLYINGQLEGTGMATFPIDYGTTPLYLGTSQVPFSGYFNGVLDETSIYNRALTMAEIQSIYNANSSGKCKPTGLNPPANQTAWFTGDGDTRDFTGLNLNGTSQGNTNYRVGKVGQSFNFDGNGDYISTADSANWDFGTGDFAIESWFNSLNPTGTQRIISAGSQADGANNLWTFGYGDNGDWGGGQRFNFAVFNGGGYSDFSSNPVTFRPNTWHHAAIVRNGTTLTFYLDGAAVGTVAIGAGFAVNGGSTGAIIGARYNNNSLSVFEFANGRLDEISVYNRGLTASEIAAVYNAGTAGKLKSATTSVNLGRSAKTSASLAPTTVQLANATVTFAQVTTAGTTSQSNVDLANFPKLPSSLTFTGLAYDISTTAVYQNGTVDDVQVCFNLPSLMAIPIANLRVLHLENGAWIDRTAMGNTYSNFCTDDLTSLSPFVIVEGLAPTAANVSVSGKITDSSGIGLGGVFVTLTDSQGNTVSVRTNNFGRYVFNEVAVGEVYTVTVSSKRYSFAVSTQAVNVQDSVSDLNFTANGEN